MEGLEEVQENKISKDLKYEKPNSDVTDKLETARSLTSEAIQIIQDKICTASNEDIKNNLWVDHVLEPLLRIVDLFAESMKSLEDLLQNEENGIKLEINTDTATNNISVVKSEQGKDPIKLDPLESDDDTFDNFVKDDIDDNFKYEQSDDAHENSLDFTQTIVKSKLKRERGEKEKKRKKKKVPPAVKGPGYCKDCKKEHIEHIEGEKKEYPCNLCDNSYSCVKTLRTHEEYHAGKFKCEICGKSVTTKDVLEAHINNKHKGPYPCEICGKLYPSINALSKHRVYHRKTTIKVSEIVMKCKICEKEFKGKFKLKEHMICHSTDKPHVCDICGASYSRGSSLYVHKQTHNEEQYSCDLCGKTLKNPQTLAMHKLTHTDISFSCAMCEKTFSSKQGLARHTKTHTGVGLYHCNLCEKSFDIKHKLIRHERTHSGIKPFHCDACNMSFYSNGELTKHKKLSIRHADNMKKMGGGEDLVNEFKNETTD